MNIEGKPTLPPFLPKRARPGPRRRSTSGPTDTLIPEGKAFRQQLQKKAMAPSLLLILHFFVLSLFIGQLSPFPLFWGFFILSCVALFLALIQAIKGINVRAWLWFLPLIIILLKFLFYPGSDWGDPSWLRSFAWGFADLFRSPSLILRPDLVKEVTQSLAPSASLFVLLSFVSWFPIFFSLEKALLYNAWGWPLFLTIFFLVWLEPLPVFSVFFLPLLIIVSGFFLLMVYRKRHDRWREKRFIYRRSDLRRSFRWSLLILLPLLLFILPWSLGRLSLSSVNFPSVPTFPSLSNSSPAPVSSSPPSAAAFPWISLPTIELPGWLESVAYISSLIIIFLVFILFAYLFFRLGKWESIGYMILFALIFVLALWLLPPYLGPILTKLFYYLNLAWHYFLGTLGFTPATPAQGGEVAPGAGEDISPAFLNFIRSILAFFSQSLVLIIGLSALALLLASYFIWRFLLRDLRKRRIERKATREVPRAEEQKEGTILSFYRQLLRLLEMLGLKRKPVETPWEYARRAEPSVPEIGLELNDLTGAFVEARYAWREPSPERLSTLERELAHVQTVVKIKAEESGSKKEGVAG